MNERSNVLSEIACRLAATAALLLLPTLLHAQTDTIHGVINRYAKVLFMCNGAFVVDNPYGFKRGDKVLIIQMKGAIIDTADSSSFGDILSYGNAGNYELAELDQVNGTTLVPKHHMVRTYDVPGLVQIVRVPTYANVVVSDTLTAKAWDGNTGGVLALIATGTLTLNADIDVTGKGFRGERLAEKKCNDTQSIAGWRFRDTSRFGGYKGESIVHFNTLMRSGRGKLATGGGGGNSRSSGGGGGGNGGTGGTGGDQAIPVTQLAIGGVGGDSCLYDTNTRRIFLGGAGGATGYEDNENPWAGSNGGGIIVLSVDTIRSNGHMVRANGADNAERDTVTTYAGAGGGGAGGTVLLEVATIADTLDIYATGGKGGKSKNSGSCYGPGGGGGGGCIWYSGASILTHSGPQIGGGVAGVVVTSAGCNNTTYGAQAGGGGRTRTHLQIPQGTVIRIP